MPHGIPTEHHLGVKGHIQRPICANKCSTQDGQQVQMQKGLCAKCLQPSVLLFWQSASSTISSMLLSPLFCMGQQKPGLRGQSTKAVSHGIFLLLGKSRLFIAFPLVEHMDYRGRGGTSCTHPPGRACGPSVSAKDGFTKALCQLAKLSMVRVRQSHPSWSFPEYRCYSLSTFHALRGCRVAFGLGFCSAPSLCNATRMGGR